METDLAIIGAGMSGLSAALFAASRGVQTLVLGGPGELVYASGLLDLLAVHPLGSQRRAWTDPWAALDALREDEPDHPLARIPEQGVRAAMDELLQALEQGALPYRRDPGANCEVITPAGTIKATHAVPSTMWAGVAALREKPPCLLVDFHGLRELSARHIAGALAPGWPGLRATRLDWPQADGGANLSPEFLARCLDRPERREALARAVAPHLGDALAVGLPAVLGYLQSEEAVADLQDRLGVPVFELPTPPVSVPGLRLQEVLVQAVRGRGARLLRARVESVRLDTGGEIELRAASRSSEYRVRARGVLLATGRFLGQGLTADRERVRETLLDLPVHQPPGRAGWHRRALLDPRGHPVNRAGLEVDAMFRPLDADREPAHPRLHAAGSVLAHQDWARSKSGSGLAVATAHAAVEAFVAAGGDR